jgi:hypothetical protein
MEISIRNANKGKANPNAPPKRVYLIMVEFFPACLRKSIIFPERTLKKGRFSVPLAIELRME